MKKLIKQYLKIYGYIPTNTEILSLYRCGNLTLTDKRENEIIKHFNL